jgi:hypothetical protein
MDQKPLKPWTVVFARSDWNRLDAHHFPDDNGEHGSVLVCGAVETERERRLLVREMLPAIDGKDYVAGIKKHIHTLVADFVSEKVGYCADQKLAYLAVHNHGMDTQVEFSPTDFASHERGYPALLDITKGGPVGALVLGGKAVAGDIWTSSERSPVEKVIVLGGRREVLFPKPPGDAAVVAAMDDRQARIFGREGQTLLSRLKVVVVGAGGAGSLLVQALAHLGVGELVVIDDEVVEGVNLRRVVGSVPSDARNDPWPGTRKVDVARRLALSINPFLVFRPVHGNIVDPEVAQRLFDADGVFLAADTMQARHVFNAICHQYLLPGFQVGAKVHAPEGRVEDAFAVSRIVGPDATCMWCSNLISRERLQKEALSPEERKAINYVQDVPAPSVITMNMMSTALALNDFLFMFTGLHRVEDLGPRSYHFLSREPVMETLPKTTCRQCAGRKGRGDRDDLPTRVVG